MNVHPATRQAFEGSAALVNGKSSPNAVDKIDQPQILTGTIAWADSRTTTSSPRGPEHATSVAAGAG
jgi:hypothetical protein